MLTRPYYTAAMRDDCAADANEILRILADPNRKPMPIQILPDSFRVRRLTVKWRFGMRKSPRGPKW